MIRNHLALKSKIFLFENPILFEILNTLQVHLNSSYGKSHVDVFSYKIQIPWIFQQFPMEILELYGSHLVTPKTSSIHPSIHPSIPRSAYGTDTLPAPPSQSVLDQVGLLSCWILERQKGGKRRSCWFSWCVVLMNGSKRWWLKPRVTAPTVQHGA